MTEEKFIEVFIKVLKENENSLTDGFCYYCDGEEYVDGNLREIALEAWNLLNEC